MIPCVIIGHGYAAHAGGVGREYAFLSVFEYGAFGRSDAKTISGFKENIRRRFHSGDIRGR